MQSLCRMAPFHGAAAAHKPHYIHVRILLPGCIRPHRMGHVQSSLVIGDNCGGSAPCGISRANFSKTNCLATSAPRTQSCDAANIRKMVIGSAPVGADCHVDPLWPRFTNARFSRGQLICISFQCFHRCTRASGVCCVPRTDRGVAGSGHDV